MEKVSYILISMVIEINYCQGCVSPRANVVRQMFKLEFRSNQLLNLSDFFTITIYGKGKLEKVVLSLRNHLHQRCFLSAEWHLLQNSRSWVWIGFEAGNLPGIKHWIKCSMKVDDLNAVSLKLEVFSSFVLEIRPVQPKPSARFRYNSSHRIHPWLIWCASLFVRIPYCHLGFEEKLFLHLCSNYCPVLNS